MESIPQELRTQLQAGRDGIGQALSRDRGRLHGLWSRWRGQPADAGLRAKFEQGLAASRAARQARAANVPAVTVDAALPLAAEADRIVQLIRDHPVVVVAGETGSCGPRVRACRAAARCG